MKKKLSQTNDAKKARERRKIYGELGICKDCGKEFVEMGHARCNKCMEKYNISMKKRDPDGSKHKEYLKNLREYRRAHGICCDCSRPALPSHVKCSIHARADRERQQVKMIRERIRKQAIEDGIVLGV